MNIKPANGRVLVKVVKGHKSESRIILPESNTSKSVRAQVVALGLEQIKEHERSIGLKLGDVVLCPKWTGTIVSEENAQDEYIIVKYEDILGIEGE